MCNFFCRICAFASLRHSAACAMYRSGVSTRKRRRGRVWAALRARALPTSKRFSPCDPARCSRNINMRLTSAWTSTRPRRGRRIYHHIHNVRRPTPVRMSGWRLFSARNRRRRRGKCTLHTRLSGLHVQMIGPLFHDTKAVPLAARCCPAAPKDLRLRYRSKDTTFN